LLCAQSAAQCTAVVDINKDNDNLCSKLTGIKSYGGLSFPSVELFSLLCTAEQHFRASAAMSSFGTDPKVLQSLHRKDDELLVSS